MRLSREVEALIAYAASTGVPHRVTSTTGGNHAETSRHYHAGTDGDGLAVDFAGPEPGDYPAMLKLYRAFMARHYQLQELIFWYPGETRTLVRRRVRVVPDVYGTKTLEAHRNHVHVSVALGTFLEPLRKELGMPDDPNLANMEGPLELHLIVDSEGRCQGYAIFSTRTGELHGYGPGWNYYGRSEDPTP